MIEIPAVISKAQLVECCNRYTQRLPGVDPNGVPKVFTVEKPVVNSAAFKIGDTEYAPRMLQYKTFAGAIDMEDRLYHGVQRFVPLAAAAPEDVEAFDFSTIPTEAPPGAAMAPKKSGAAALSDQEIMAEANRRGLLNATRMRRAAQEPQATPVQE